MKRIYFDSINAILTISGLRPAFDRPTKNGRKYNLPGIIFVIIHIGLSALSDYHEGYQREILSHFYDKIMFAMVTLKRIVNFLYPIWMILGVVGQFRWSTIFHEKLDKMDWYLESNNANMKGLRENLRKFTLLVLLLSFCAGAGSVWSTCSYIKEIFNYNDFPQFVAGFYYLGFALVTLKVCKYLHGVKLRMELFIECLQRINLKKQAIGVWGINVI